MGVIFGCLDGDDDDATRTLKTKFQVPHAIAHDARRGKCVVMMHHTNFRVSPENAEKSYSTIFVVYIFAAGDV